MYYKNFIMGSRIIFQVRGDFVVKLNWKTPQYNFAFSCLLVSKLMCSSVWSKKAVAALG